MLDRKSFLQRMGALGGAAFLAPLMDSGLKAEIQAAAAQLQVGDPQAVASNEAIWKTIRKAFDYPTDFINLENGYYSPMPKPVFDAHLADDRRINHLTTFYMRREMDADREKIRERLALFAGIDKEELALTRNTTESLDLLFAGIGLKRGDEVICSNFDYGSMLEMLDQMAERDGIVVKRVILPPVPDSNEDLIAPFRNAITESTKLMLVTHMINLNGQILPAKELCRLGKHHKIAVVVDAAHSFAHINFKLPELEADYLGSSLHKWLSAPLGNGLLAVKKDKIAGVWPLLGDVGQPKDNIRKFEHQGTRPPADWLGIAHAITFHEGIGGAQKEARLRYLKNYWAERVKDLPHVTLKTSLKPEFSCAIANVAVKGKSPAELADYLFKEHKIWTVAIGNVGIEGVRVTPHLYNTTADLDALVRALELAK